MKRMLQLALAGCLACGSAQELRLDSVSPAQVQAPADRMPLLLRGQFVAPIDVDLDAPGDTTAPADDTFLVSFSTGVASSSVAAQSVKFRSNALLEVVAPASLGLGPHDVWVTDPMGRGSVLPGALTVFAQAAVALHLTAAPGSLVAGTAHDFTVTATDAAGHTLTDYIGTVTLGATPSDPAFAQTTLSFSLSDHGTKTTSLRFTHAGKLTLSAADGSAEPGTLATAVVAAPLSRLTAAPVAGQQVAGRAFSLALTAADAFGNPVTASLALSAPGIPASAITPLLADVAGSSTVQVTITRTAASTTLTFANSDASGSTNSFAIASAPMAHLSLSAPSCFSSGQAFPIALDTTDTYGNRADVFTGQVDFTADNSASVSPTRSPAFKAGQLSTDVTITVPGLTLPGGSYTLTATAVGGTASASAAIAYPFSCP